MSPSEAFSTDVTCVLVGGPSGQREIRIALRFCRDRIRVESGHWFAQEEDGSISAIYGDRDENSPWVSYDLHIYIKTAPVRDARARYEYVETFIVNRCEKIIGRSRRCRAEVVPGEHFCRAHRPRAKQPSSMTTLQRNER